MPDTTGTVDEDGAVGGVGMPEATMASGAGSRVTTAAGTKGAGTGVSDGSTPGAGSSTPGAGTTGLSAQGVPVGE